MLKEACSEIIGGEGGGEDSTDHGVVSLSGPFQIRVAINCWQNCKSRTLPSKKSSWESEGGQHNIDYITVSTYKCYCYLLAVTCLCP